MNTLYKNESFILFNCILVIILFYFIYCLYNFLYKYGCNYQKYKSYKKKMENFGSYGNSKRDKMIKIYKDDTILDPDDAPYNNKYDDDNNDPDSTFGYDPH